MDEIDIAAESTALHLKLAIEQMRMGSVPGTSHCEDCGAEIPLLRREAMPSCTRCVRCQAAHELR